MSSAISESHNRAHKILEFVDISPNVSFTTENGKYELTDELPNNVRLKKF